MSFDPRMANAGKAKQPGHGHKGGFETLEHARRVAKRRKAAKLAKASRKRNR